MSRLPTAPLLRELRRAAQYNPAAKKTLESRRWALANEHLHFATVDSICVETLGAHPSEIYGEDWFLDYTPVGNWVEQWPILHPISLAEAIEEARERLDHSLRREGLVAIGKESWEVLTAGTVRVSVQVARDPLRAYQEVS